MCACVCFFLVFFRFFLVVCAVLSCFPLFFADWVALGCVVYCCSVFFCLCFAFVFLWLGVIVSCLLAAFWPHASSATAAFGTSEGKS